MFGSAKAKVAYEVTNWKLASRDVDRQVARSKGASKADAARHAIRRTPARRGRR